MPIVIPLPKLDGGLTIVIIMSQQNMERIAASDPQAVRGAMLAPLLVASSPFLPHNPGAVPISAVDIIVAYEPNIEEFLAWAYETGRSSGDLMRRISRGATIHPGDEKDRVAYNLSALLDMADRGPVH